MGIFSLTPRPIRGEGKDLVSTACACVLLSLKVSRVFYFCVYHFPQNVGKLCACPRSGNQPFLFPSNGSGSGYEAGTIIQFNEDVCSLTTRMSCVSLVMNHSCEFLYSPAELERNLMCACTLASPSLTHEPTPISPPLTSSPIPPPPPPPSHSLSHPPLSHLPPLTPSPISPLSLSLIFLPSALTHTIFHFPPCSLLPHSNLPYLPRVFPLPPSLTHRRSESISLTKHRQ